MSETRYLPQRDPVIDEEKRLTRPWVMYLEKLAKDFGALYDLCVAFFVDVVATTVSADTLTLNGTLAPDTVATFHGQTVSPLVSTHAGSAAAPIIDWVAGNQQLLTLTDNTTLTLVHPVDGGRYDLLVKTGAGGFALSWPTNVAWTPSAPTLTITASRMDWFTLIYVYADDTYYGTYAQDFTTP